MERNLTAGPVPRVGVARHRGGGGSAAATALAKRGEPDARSRMLVAENAIELGACRATLSRAATLVDACDGTS